jgi:hypothetical protein
MAGSSPWNNIDSVHPGIHIKTVYKHDQTNDDQTIINQRLRPVCKATAKNPRKYNKQDPKKTYPQNCEQGNDQCLFIHDSRNPFPISF